MINTICGWPVQEESCVLSAVVSDEAHDHVITGQHHGIGMRRSTIPSFSLQIKSF